MSAIEQAVVVTLGEVLAVLRSEQAGPLRWGQSMRLSIAGSESNVAIGVSRLGHSAVFVGRTGADALGSVVRSALLGAGVAAELSVDPERPTGLMLVERRMHDVRRVQYYRRDSAGSALTPDDVEAATFVGARLLHVTGITPLLSDSAAAAVAAAVAQARSHGIPVSLDLNYRSALAAPEQFRAALKSLVAAADIVFASVDEARLFVGGPAQLEPEDLAAAMTGCGAAEIVLTGGHHGAWGFAGGRSFRQPAAPVTATDPIGAGDAFVAGYLAAWLEGQAFQQRLVFASRVAAVCVGTDGDWEGLPGSDELDLLELEHGAVRR